MTLPVSPYDVMRIVNTRAAEAERRAQVRRLLAEAAARRRRTPWQVSALRQLGDLLLGAGHRLQRIGLADAERDEPSLGAQVQN